MAVPHRHASIPGTYFITSRTWESRRLFVVDSVCTLFVETLFANREKRFYLVHAFVLMPDHFHILLTPGPETTLERAAQLIKGGSAHTIGKERRMAFPVWQRGFSDHRIRDAADYSNHLRYIDQNPVRKKLAVEPCEYRWSSASGKYVLDPFPQGLKPEKQHDKENSIGTAEAVP